MKVCGIIAEYNPFHNGHAYQLRFAREVLHADHIVIAMSGDFVQRGAPALLDKHTRAAAALKCGADLVLELPVSVSTGSAEYFAAGAVQLLDSLGIVDLLCFGAGQPSPETFSLTADLLNREPPLYRSRLRQALASGQSFASARETALKEVLPEEVSSDFLKDPNNILGIEYCRAIKTLGSRILPVPHLREGASHNDASFPAGASSASAGAIRNFMKEAEKEKASPGAVRSALSGALPPESLSLLEEAYEKGLLMQEDVFSGALLYRLFSEDEASLSRYLDVSEDLAKRICRLRSGFRSVSQFAQLIKTRNITLTRARRALFHILLSIENVPASIPYVRVLGMKREAGSLLSRIAEACPLPLVTSPAAAERSLSSEGKRVLAENTRASMLYKSQRALLAPDAAYLHEYEEPMVIF